MHTYEIQILEKHLDTFGHVNNAVYLSLFEEARWDFVTRNNYGLKRVLETGLGPIILEVNLKFAKELRLREFITITTSVPQYRRRIGKIVQEMTNREGETCTKADFTFGLFDLKKRALVTPTEEWLNALGVKSLDSGV